MARPEITIFSVARGTNRWANSGPCTIRWRVEGNPDTVLIGGGVLSSDLIADGQAVDMASGGGSDNQPAFGELNVDGSRTYDFQISASNADGTAGDNETIYSKVPVGYHQASIPGAPARQSELDLIRGYLQEIEERLRQDRLAGIEDWLAGYNRDNPDQAFPQFPHIDYLKKPVGEGGLADDILRSMQSVLVHLRVDTLPRTFRPGFASGSVLCEGNLFGVSPRERDGWCSICIEIGAAETTLLHELYHVATQVDLDAFLEEESAFAISYCVFDVA